MRAQRGVWVVAAIASAALVAVLLAAPVQAGISGPCAATINGENVANRSTSATAEPITVDRHSQVPVAMSSSHRIRHLTVELEFGGVSWSVHDEPTRGTSWTRDVNVDKYAKYGVGVYKVSGTSSAGSFSCTGAALVNVDGNPLGTVAGGAGLALAALGGLGVLGAGVAARTETRKAKRTVEEWTTDQLQTVGQAQGARQPEAQAKLAEEDERELDVDTLEALGWDRLLPGSTTAVRMGIISCSTLALVALLLTTGSMLLAVVLPRAHWRPRISILGLLGGLACGLGVGVLLQQYAVLYPTRTVAIIELAVGLGVGVVLPSIVRAFGVAGINRALARAEERANAARA